MKVIVRVEGRAFEVEIENLSSRPIVALIEGERFEIWPEETKPAARTSSSAALSASSQPAVQQQSSASNPAKPSSAKNNLIGSVRAPLPGLIMSIAVQVGDHIEVGQEMCVIEAMKMKNSIRAPRTGEIGKVTIKEGDHIQHHDLLFEYAE